MKNNSEEIAFFNSMSDDWWDENGPFKPLHMMNPPRLEFIRDEIFNHFNTDTLKGLNILDIGCGGGLLCEPLARMGGSVTGVDGSDKAIKTAQSHKNNLDITYKNCMSHDITEQFDVVCALEIIEHVDSIDDFVTECLRLLKPNGLVFFSTLNRTAKSFAISIAAAEHILRFLPVGTHDWKKFVKPSEITRALRKNNAAPQTVNGIIYSLRNKQFKLSASDLDVNYILSARQNLL